VPTCGWRGAGPFRQASRYGGRSGHSRPSCSTETSSHVVAARRRGALRKRTGCNGHTHPGTTRNWNSDTTMCGQRNVTGTLTSPSGGLGRRWGRSRKLQDTGNWWRFGTGEGTAERGAGSRAPAIGVRYAPGRRMGREQGTGRSLLRGGQPALTQSENPAAGQSTSLGT
jgi:hypothetical protein